MSSPPSASKNAAPLVPVTSPMPAHPRGSDATEGPGAPGGAETGARPAAAHAATLGSSRPAQEAPEAPEQHEKHIPASATSPPANHGPGLKPSQSTPPSLDQNKKQPAPTLMQRSTGPSLLTQALASARGIQSLGQRDTPSQPSYQTTTPANDSPGQRQLPNPLDTTVTEPHYPYDDFESESDGGSLTPRAPPRPAGMASSTAVATPSPVPASHRDAVPTVYNVLDLGQVSSILQGHRDFANLSKRRSRSAERTGEDFRDHEGLHVADIDSPHPGDTIVPGSVHGDGALALADAQAQEEPVGDLPNGQKSRKTEQWVSMSAEKAWSIGSGEPSHGQDGQVEKSITDVLAGVEHNTRSRKASHSLRFFKEGLPEEREKLKRRESRLSGQPKDMFLPTPEIPTEIERPAEKIEAQARSGLSKGFPKSVESLPIVPSKLSKMESIDTLGLASSDAKDSAHHPTMAPEGDKGYVDKTESVPERVIAHVARQTSHVTPSEPPPSQQSPEGRRKSGDSTKTGESGEEGEESGEEKISSAVFLPHQGLEEAPEFSQPLPGSVKRVNTGPRSISRSDDFHPWLVKADEPEIDEQQPETEVEFQVHTPARTVQKDRQQTAAEGRAPVDKDKALQPSEARTPASVTPHYEDHVHEHQKQPLDAIELIPYKHQVGGHTTLWRFSKRAVCKQLNNRENEFYERVEQYHRDLLSFLPRYIGVLNVTFHKQPRRKSTLKREDGAAVERRAVDQNELRAIVKMSDEGAIQSDAVSTAEDGVIGNSAHHRVISQSMQGSNIPIPTVTFVDNQHILPRNLLQPIAPPTSLPLRLRNTSESTFGSHTNGTGHISSGRQGSARPTLDDRHANSWGATTVNKKLRNEVFNDAFLKEPIDIQKHRRGHQRSVPRRSVQNILRSTSSDPNLVKRGDQDGESAKERAPRTVNASLQMSQSDVGPSAANLEIAEAELRDVTGTSAPEADILTENMIAQKKKRRYSANGLRRRPRNVSESRGNLKYFEEADDAGYKGDHEDASSTTGTAAHSQPRGLQHGVGSNQYLHDMSEYPSTVTSGTASPTAEFKRIQRPINPKEAQTQRDSRVEYFLLLEDLTAGMKRPCIMDLKMGTRQYGVDATPKKQKSQKRKCADTTSRELGVRVCGLQVWDSKTQNYIFKDKYYGRNLKAGQEFQDALTRFLYDGVDKSSILRHIPTVLQKLSQLEVIIRRLRGYRFYAASLLMFYDAAEMSPDDNDTTVDDSTTDFATDTEEHRETRRGRRNKRDIDFKMADFANSVIWGDLNKNKPCPPQHLNEADAGFLRGLRSLRAYFLKIQRDTRIELGLATALRNGPHEDELILSEVEGDVSE